MDQATLDNLLRMMSSDNDSDAVMGLRGMQGLLRVEGIDMGRALTYVVQNKHVLTQAAPAQIEQAGETLPAMSKAALPAVEISGMPQCYSPHAGHIEIIVPGQTSGEIVALPPVAAQAGTHIAMGLKDALVAAAINKSRFKLKLNDNKNERGDVLETQLRAEYEREGMVPVIVWAGVPRGEAATLATVLRRAVASAMPELVAD